MKPTTNESPAGGACLTQPVRRPYKCGKCRKTTNLSDDDIWGKVVRCVHCTEVLMDNRHTGPPNARSAAARDNNQPNETDGHSTN